MVDWDNAGGLTEANQRVAKTFEALAPYNLSNCRLPFPIRMGEGPGERPGERPRKERNAMEEWIRPNKTGIIFGRSAPEKRERAHQLKQATTPAETRLWQFLRGNRLSGLHFRRQQVIDGFIVDFYCHAAALIVETDGKVHDAAKEYDATRDHLFTLRGLRVVRIPNEDVINNIAAVLQTIYTAAENSGLTLPPFESLVESPVTNNDSCHGDPY